jgi:NAD(P)H-flavin reductase
MRETQAIIERVRRVSPTVQQLDLSVDGSLLQLLPGQSLFAIPLENENWNPYLREQWIPVAIHSKRVVVELPVERVYTPNQVVSVLAPVGRPIPLRPNIRHMLLIAENSLPTPFILLARNLIANQVAVTMVATGKATHYPLELLPPEIEIIHGDSEWKWPEQFEMLTWADQVITLAPGYTRNESYNNLYQTIKLIRQHDVPDGHVSGMFYQRLACGAGACHACQIACHSGDLLICADGPAFDLKDVVFK